MLVVFISISVIPHVAQVYEIIFKAEMIVCIYGKLSPIHSNFVGICRRN